MHFKPTACRGPFFFFAIPIFLLSTCDRCVVYKTYQVFTSTSLYHTEPRQGFEPWTPCLQNRCSAAELSRHFRSVPLIILCQVKDSNLRRRTPTDLQSVPVDRLGNLAYYWYSTKHLESFDSWSPGRESDPRPPSYQEGVLPLNYLGAYILQIQRTAERERQTVPRKGKIGGQDAKCTTAQLDNP